MLARCVHCDAELVAPVRTEYWSDKHARHIWLCPKCCACFSSVVSFPAEVITRNAPEFLFQTVCSILLAGFVYFMI